MKIEAYAVRIGDKYRSYSSFGSDEWRPLSPLIKLYKSPKRAVTCATDGRGKAGYKMLIAKGGTLEVVKVNVEITKE